jgi:hypothetical protein
MPAGNPRANASSGRTRHQLRKSSRVHSFPTRPRECSTSLAVQPPFGSAHRHTMGSNPLRQRSIVHWRGQTPRQPRASLSAGARPRRETRKSFFRPVRPLRSTLDSIFRAVRPPRSDALARQRRGSAPLEQRARRTWRRSHRVEKPFRCAVEGVDPLSNDFSLRTSWAWSIARGLPRSRSARSCNVGRKRQTQRSRRRCSC